MEKFMEHTKEHDNNRLEQQRLEGQHEVMIYHMGKAVYAPVDFSHPGLRILDSGCANGRWLRDLRASSPAKHEYFGTDVEETLYPKRPPEGMHFQNQSIRDDFPAAWQDSFDLIHQRFVMAASGGIPAVIDKLVHMLKPGGWMQLIKTDGNPIPETGPMLSQFLRMLREVFSAVGSGENFGKALEKNMEDAGLECVEQKVIYSAHGATIEDKSLLQKSIQSPCAAVEGITEVLKVLPTSIKADELDGFEARLRRELEERGGHLRILVVWGRKPFS